MIAVSEKKFQIPRTQNPPRPAPFPIGRLASESYPLDAKRVAILPELILTLATPFACGCCDGARTDFVAQTRVTDRAFIPCRLCQGEGAVLPGETVIVDQAAVQLRVQNQVITQLFGRVRSPWMGADDWRDTIFWSKQVGGDRLSRTPRNGRAS